MSYHQQEGSAHGYSAESSDEPFHNWPTGPPMVHSSVAPANTNGWTNFDSAQHSPQPVIRAPTFPGTPYLHSTRQQNAAIPSTVNLRQLYQPASTTAVGTVRLEGYQNGGAQTSSLHLPEDGSSLYSPSEFG
jgi:hypothetical protein